MAENPTLRLLLLIVAQRVGHHKVYGLVHLNEVAVLVIIGVLRNLVTLLRIPDTELRGIGTVALVLLLAQFTIGLAHAALHFLAAGSDVFGTEGTVLHLLLVFPLDAPQLFYVNASLHQLGDNLLT